MYVFERAKMYIFSRDQLFAALDGAKRKRIFSGESEMG